MKKAIIKVLSVVLVVVLTLTSTPLSSFASLCDTDHLIEIKEDAPYSPVIDTTNNCNGQFTGTVYGIDTLGWNDEIEAHGTISDFLTTEYGDEYLEINTENTVNGDETTGTIINVLDTNGNIIESYVFVYFGDVDMDGMVGFSDGYICENYELFYTGFSTLYQFMAGDIDGDGMPTASDAYIMRNWEANFQGMPHQYDIAIKASEIVYEMVTKKCPTCGSYNNETISGIAPTCTEDGFRTYTCSFCGDTYTEAVSATGHVNTTTTTVDPTYTADGKTTVTCDDCGVVVDETVIHNYENGICTICGASEVNEEKSIAILTTEKSLCVKTGEKFELAFGLMENGLLTGDWKKMAVTVSDPTIISLSDYKEVEYGYSLDVIGKKEGTTNVTITDTDTGVSTVIAVSVFDTYSKTYSYPIENIDPANSMGYEDTIIYNLNGLFVDNYSCKKVGDTYYVSFNAYNQKYHTAAVDIFDAHGNWIGSEEIKKYSDISSLFDTGEQLWHMVTNWSWTSYKHAMQSKETPIEIEVPEGGHFTISNNFAESPGCFLYNSCEIFYEGISAAIDVLTDDIETPFIDLITGKIVDNKPTRELFYELFIKAADKGIREYTKNILNGNIDNAYCSISGLFENLLYSLEIDWKNCLKTVSGVGESAFEKFAGPAGLALQGCFAITEATNKLLQARHLAVSVDEPYATVYSSIDEGFINQHGITVNTNGNVDADAVLQVFRISNSDAVEVILNSDNPLEQHELYNICFVKNDKTVQPSGLVKVYVPIPEGMDGNTCKIYRQEEDGSWSILDATLEGNYLVFETDHFSLYALIGDKSELNISSLPNKLTYTRNDVLDTTGLVLNINGETITEGYYCDPSVAYKLGTQTITVKYGYTTATFTIEVIGSFAIQTPSRTEIRNKDGIVLHANVEGTAPVGSYVVWTSSNGNFDEDADGNILTVIAQDKGYTTFTAILYDAEGNVLATDSVELYSKSGFFDKIGGFFRSLFGSTKIYEN